MGEEPPDGVVSLKKYPPGWLVKGTESWYYNIRK